MTREYAKELLPIITAYCEGKIIQYKSADPSDLWKDFENLNFDSSPLCYRIKPEPRTFRIAIDKINGMIELADHAYNYLPSQWEIIKVKEVL